MKPLNPIPREIFAVLERFGLYLKLFWFYHTFMLGFYSYTLMSMPLWFCHCANMAIWSDYALLAMRLGKEDRSQCISNGKKPYGLYLKESF